MHQQLRQAIKDYDKASETIQQLKAELAALKGSQ